MATKAQITQLYRTYLGREPDAAGLEFYSNPDFSLSLIADDIANSAEARRFAAQAAENEAISARQYATGNAATEADVRAAYQDILGREPDEAGLNFYLESDFSPEQIREVLLASPERQGMAAREYATGTPATEAEVRQIYRDVLGREADKAGLQFYLGSNFSADQIRANILGSPESMELATNPAQRAGFTPGTQPAFTPGTQPGFTGVMPMTTSEYLSRYFNPQGPYGAGRFLATVNPLLFSAPDGMQRLPAAPTRQTAQGAGAGTTESTGGGGVTNTVGGGSVGVGPVGGPGLLSTNQTTGNTATFDPNTGGVYVGSNIVDPISGSVIGNTQGTFDRATGGVIQGGDIVDPISGAVIGVAPGMGYDLSTGGVVQGRDIIDPISGAVIGQASNPLANQAQPGFDLNTGGVIQGTSIVDPISGAVIGRDYSGSMTGGLIPGLVDMSIGSTFGQIGDANFIPVFGRGNGMLLDFADIPAFGQGGGMLLDYVDSTTGK